MASQSSSWDEVVEKVLMGPYDTDVVFHKHMAKHIFWEEDLSFFDHPESIHVLLIRDPIKQLASWHRTKYERSMNETGLVHQFELISHLVAHDKPVIVVDSCALLANPRGVLTELCNRCGIPFFESMLEWPAGPRKEDGAWAYYYYHSVHKSTHFSTAVTPVKPFPAEMKPLLGLCEPIYTQLRRYAIGLSSQDEDAGLGAGTDLVWVVDRMLTRNNAAVSAVDASVQDGEAIRGCLRVINETCPLLDDHAVMMEALARAKGFPKVCTAAEICQAIGRTLAVNDVHGDAVVRVVHVPLGLVVSIERYAESEMGATEAVVSTTHVDMAAADGAAAAAAAAIRLVPNAAGVVANADEVGLCIVKRSTIVAPPEGVFTAATGVNQALTVLDEIAKKVKLGCERRDIKVDELGAADELFTLTMHGGVSAVAKIGGVAVGVDDGEGGPVTAKVAAAFEALLSEPNRWQALPSSL
mmetsp:Transcript_16144/g.41872  ORF Transcript_16144/g.41872 Transcript_16144/m.41872 type:complete len:469 (+) Transcript_16144:296-1702(+)